MNANRSLTAGAFLLMITGASPCGISGQSDANPKGTPSLRGFYQGLVGHYNPSSLPKDEELVKVMHQIEAAPAGEISGALPSIFSALAHQDDKVKLDARAALIVISLRPDSATLLTTYIQPIGDLLTSPNERLQGIGLAILSYLKPSPTPEAAAPILAFLKRADADRTAQADAVRYLVRYGPDNAEQVGAILDFLDRPLDRGARIATLNALGTPQIKNPNIVDRVIGSLDDRDPAIRSTAADVLSRMSQDALLLARPTLERLAGDKAQPADVRDAARRAPERMGHSAQ